jgi:Na+/alanine symporter
VDGKFLQRGSHLNKIVVVVTIFVAAFIALIAYSTLAGPRFRVEVCMEYQGRSACRTVSAKSEQAAIRSGAENACADIASGVTDTMRCVGAEPKSVKWLRRPR